MDEFESQHVLFVVLPLTLAQTNMLMLMLMLMVQRRPTGTEMHKPTPLYFFSTGDSAFCYGTCIIIYF